ncbi:MAG: OmpW family outer membrane protein [Xanthomonadales bacterium]|nr:OmpW family outer membrane protein [Xanthomonadales bacterium]
MAKKSKAVSYLALLLGIASLNTAIAMEPGDWLIRFGLSNADPKSNNHDVVEVDSAVSATFNVDYMMTANWSVEVLAAYPFEHDIHLIGGPKVGETKHLPPTVSLNYHFLADAAFQPYVGLGVNYTNFFSEKTMGALEGTSLDLDDSWGFAAQVGADIMLGEAWFLNVNARYIDIETDATLDGAPLGTVEIDPWVYGAHLGFRF